MTDQNDAKLAIWNALKTPPTEALKEIKGGRLKGKSDINPQWRMRVMTEQFGPCGVGWRYEIVKLWTEAAGVKGEVVALALVNVFFRVGDEAKIGEDIWSQAIPGIGGNMLVEQESGGPHVSDECFKMAVTDALSVAFKALGVAADVYMGKFDSKYDQRGGKAAGGGQRPRRQPRDEGLGKCPKCGTFLRKAKTRDGGQFIGCQGYPDCRYTTPVPKEGEAKPEAAPAAQPAQEAEEICPLCGQHPINSDGYCPNEGKGAGQPSEAQPQEQAEPGWRPQCCGRTMMPRAGLDGGASFWQCPRCKKKRDMSEEERKRVGL